MRCANPDCQAETNYLRGGGLYWIEDRAPEGEARKGRFIWLCTMCLGDFAIETWRPPGQQMRRRSAAEPSHAA